MSYNEIARELNLSVNKVIEIEFVALRKMQAILAKNKELREGLQELLAWLDDGYIQGVLR
ncbi:hypothetical protein CBLAS_0893 [Campylobacter blaseri]|uniref:RNA polymerase sigma-70 region 4 domain-containing protein n=1 Tax=Campylobacter blaseri TaxID=2042961 RepID=A0A2P8R2P2_9BACT|nr:hypothetical protein [Campylobacter blaseri]PSM52767.1 hypothetical protein CQ405_03320 [Campylobacter blaseri]PSM54415.1 hypothetical protein CRN67_03320 [Campylobacter blaseri]QKF86078.1 hypothetical protein CBLAS_0893 [Campylobacter blaseri]